MTDNLQTWTTYTLFEALQTTDLLASGQATVELVDGIEPALHIVMEEYGDLPLFLTVAGEQIIVESTLWPISDVANPTEFNDAVLRTHKYFPLSTISLDGDIYHMFGALSSTSILQNIVFEIEVLASNVIQATEAYSEFLNLAIEAS